MDNNIYKTAEESLKHYAKGLETKVNSEFNIAYTIAKSKEVSFEDNETIFVKKLEETDKDILLDFCKIYSNFILTKFIDSLLKDYCNHELNVCRYNDIVKEMTEEERMEYDFDSFVQGFLLHHYTALLLSESINKDFVILRKEEDALLEVASVLNAVKREAKVCERKHFLEHLATLEYYLESSFLPKIFAVGKMLMHKYKLEEQTYKDKIRKRVLAHYNPIYLTNLKGVVEKSKNKYAFYTSYINLCKDGVNADKLHGASANLFLNDIENELRFYISTPIYTYNKMLGEVKNEKESESTKE